MKKLISKIGMAMLLVTFYSCEQEEQSLKEHQGTVRFGDISLEFAPMGSPGSRIMGNSTWVHVFPNSADLVFINKATGKEYVLEYNPNDFSTPYSIILPFGAYEYHSIIEGGIFSAFLPFEARGEFFLDSQSLEISLEADTDYGLVTVKDQYVEKASISDGEKETDLEEHQDGKYWFMYVKGGTEATLNIKESFQGSTISRELNIEESRHYNFIMKLNDGVAKITDLILALFELEEEEILIGMSSKFFEENGTIKCPEAIPGEKGMVNEKVYEAVNRALLFQRRDEGADLTCVCTSLVTDMSRMFEGAIKFNQPIGNWDLSNVTDMTRMFVDCEFFQEIGNWDVSNVTTMEAMFMNSLFRQDISTWDVGNVTNMARMFSSSVGFNQPIGNWDVSNVVNMSGMFYEASFNQPIGNWDVSSVKYMNGMLSKNGFNQPIEDWDVSNVTSMRAMFFENTSFNQPVGKWDVGNVTNMFEMFAYSNFNQTIENWDVGNVTNMSSMFDFSPFNQPIGNWNVSNVTDMSRIFASTPFDQPIENWKVGKVTNMNHMFASTPFNQPIGNWNVANVTDMGGMFVGTPFNHSIESWDVRRVTNMNSMFASAPNFNQNLTSWCVEDIPSEPGYFSRGSALLDANKPVWGTCPE